MKTRKAVLAAGLMAGLATLPLSARADSTAPALPHGSASASAVTVQLSLAPVVNTVGTQGWQQVTAALTTLRDTLCPGSTPTTTTCPLGITLPTGLPTDKPLSVYVAQARDDATLTAAGTDVLSGSSQSAPVATDWDVLNANIGAVETQIANFINNGANALQQNGVTGLTDYLQAQASAGGATITVPALGVAHLNILGTVAASLGQKNVADNPDDHANAVAIKLNGNTVQQLDGATVSVDPFNAYALNGATTARDGKTGPQVSADNTTAALQIPALMMSNTSSANLSALSSLLKSLVDALSKAIADPTQAGNILSSVPGVPAPLQSTLTQIGGLVNQTLGTVAATTGAAPVPVDLSALKLWDAKLSASLDGLNALIAALKGLGIPDLGSLVSVTKSIATSKTVPVAGGGVESTATARVGQLALLPIGSQLSQAINAVITNLPATGGITVNTTHASTPLLQIEGITSAADAAVGPGTGAPVGTAGLNTVTVLGQTIDLNSALPNLNGALPGAVPTTQALGPGQEWHHVFTVPGVGSVTLDITRGVQNTVANLPTYREVSMAALDVRLMNGDVACTADPSNCHDLVPGTSTSANGAAPKTAGGIKSGIQGFGDDGSNIARIALADTTAAASMTGQDNPPCATNCSQPAGCNGPGSGPTCPLPDTANITSLPKTGMLGGLAIPAGLLLIAVAISLRVAPGLWARLRRVR
ncbi:MAG TPA: hypothetical protein VN193_02395 [Candidatus Angelobacter sp.]|nr:hypothetical protein [Candidatus Angelobacter sp.]